MAYHYFECAWAGNAAKAVEYCRRAADQAMARLAYEGAADLYDKALHALEEIDDELPDRDDQQAELLVARCEALLAAGDVVSAKGAVSQLQQAASVSARLAAWGTCFDGQLSMLTDPERLDEIESALSAAAEKLAGLEDAAGEAKAHTVRAGCLARLGRIGDAETALDQALTAARRAREHRRVNNVLANAPLAALWGPNPVPRAGGRCLDVIRLLRITTGSPVVEATSTRCQGVLDAFRGRAAAGRALIDSARRTLTELGMRHALLEVDQFAGLVELVADDPASAEPHLRRAYNGFRRMGLDADTAETAALLARACLALDRDTEADELCTESEHLAGHALKASIAWRTVRAELSARRGAHDEARRMAEEAVAVAGRTDLLVDHGDACLTLATVLGAAGDIAGARTAADKAVELYELKGAAALAEKARAILGVEVPTAPVPSETPSVEPDNACTRVIGHVVAALNREDWSEVEQLCATDIEVESRRQFIRFTRDDLFSGEWTQNVRRLSRVPGDVHYRHGVVAVRGERLALIRLELRTADGSHGAPQSEMLQLVGLDQSSRVALLVWFDVEDMDAALAELDAAHARLGERPPRVPVENAASRAGDRLNTLFAEKSWEEIGALFADDIRLDDRRLGLRRESNDRANAMAEVRLIAELGTKNITTDTLAIRGEHLVLSRARFSGRGRRPDAFHTELLRIVEIAADERIVAVIDLDPDDLDTAFEELDSRYLAGEAAPFAQVWRMVMDGRGAMNRHEPLPATWGQVAYVDHRHVPFAPEEFGRAVTELWTLVPDARYEATAVHALNAHGTVINFVIEGTDIHGSELQWPRMLLIFFGDGETRMDVFEVDDVDAALVRFDELSRPAQQLENAAIRVAERYIAHFTVRDWDAMSTMLADDVWTDDRRRVVNKGVRIGRDAEIANVQTLAELGCANISSTPIATRGERLVLAHDFFTFRDGTTGETIDVMEIDADNQIVALITFDPDDFDTAITELDSRYVAGEAAAHAHTWSVISRAFAAVNRHELPEFMPDFVNVDHRRAIAFAPGDLTAYMRATWDLAPDVIAYAVAVHQLSDIGAVFTEAVSGISQDGFDAEWRMVNLLTVDGNLINRIELFEEANLDAALAKFDGLSRPVPRLENAATKVEERFQACFAARDWAAMGEILADDISADDRRRVVNAGIRHGRDAKIADMRATADLGTKNGTSTVIAIRGQRLALVRIRLSGRDQRPDAFHTEMLGIAEIDADSRMTARVLFDVDDIDAAFEELDTRYLAGEAASHAHAWSAIAKAYAGFNRREFSATTAEWEDVDHRRGAAFAPGDMMAYLQAAWDDSPDTKIYIAAVHRLSDLGVVVTHAAHGISQEGFDAEWRDIHILMVEGETLSRSELFDESDIDAALARFDELSRPAPQLANAASQIWERLNAYFSSGNWAAMSQVVAQNMIDDDRRRTVNGGIRRGKDIQIANGQAVAETGADKMTSTVIAIRGERLALCRSSFFVRDQQPGTFRIEFLSVIEIDVDGQLVAHVGFDLDDLDAAFEELDARYLAGEAAAYRNTWSVIAQAYASINRHEPPPLTPDCVNIDHRRTAVAIAPGDLIAYIRSGRELGEVVRPRMEVVHRLTNRGAVITYAANGTSPTGFEAEWREISLSVVDGDLINRVEIFDESDIDAAVAKFEQLTGRGLRLESAASQVAERYWTHFADRNWDALAEILTDEFWSDDRRRMVGAGVRHGRNAEIEDLRAIFNLGLTNVTSTIIATRGGRLILGRVLFSGPDHRPESALTEILGVIEIAADQRITATIVFDPDDLDAAFEELDTRYVAGEAAPYSHTWSVVAEASAAVNRHEIPPTTPRWVNIDHRRGTAFAPGDAIANIRAWWDLTPEAKAYIEAVHRLSNLGAVVSYSASGTSQEGFDAEWRLIELLTVDGDLFNRCEIFDETDLDAAVARFDELSRPAPRLENAASQAYERFKACFAARDWDVLAEILADDVYSEDRRRVVNAGQQQGRDAVIAEMSGLAEFVKTVTSETIASRGARLVLGRARVEGYEAFLADVLDVIEVDADGLVVRRVVLDPDDFDAAFEELDARYLAGEAAAHAHTWSVIARGLAAFNRRELPGFTPDSVNIDHRLARGFAPGDLTAYIGATWDLAPDVSAYAEAVHRLSNLAAVWTHAVRGTSQDGFDAEWREICLATVEGDLINRIEMFDEQDIDAALAKFDELTQTEPQLENAASQMDERFWAYFAARDWPGTAAILADDVCTDDRRRVVNAGLRQGRDAVIAEVMALAEVGLKNVTPDVVATRGERLVLSRVRLSVRDQGAGEFYAEVFAVVEIDTENRMLARVVFDLEDIEAAFEDLDARYLAGEAAANAHTWSVIAQGFAAINRRELPATTPDWTTIDHQRFTTMAPDDFIANIRASWDVAPDLEIYIAAIHRLSDLGAVVTHAGHGTSQEGFNAEWRMIELLTVAGDLINRCELFDEADLDSALARFDELTRPAPQLENAASRVDDRFEVAFAARDFDVMAGMLTDEVCIDDRRRVVNAGVRRGRDVEIASMRATADLGVREVTSSTIATRGERLALSRNRFVGRDQRPEAFHSEALCIIEIDTDERILVRVTFDPDQIDAAIAELDARYLAGEAAEHAHTWSVIAGGFNAVNRREIPATTADFVDIDHRQVAGIGSGDLRAYLSAAFDDLVDNHLYVESVHRLTGLGAVITHMAKGTSLDGLDVEWRLIDVVTIDGDLMNRYEMFDETDLDAALTKFAELSRSTPRLENAASQAAELLWTCFAARDWGAMAELMADDIVTDDRRRVVNAGIQHGRDVEIANMRNLAEIGANIAMTVIATRGGRLALCRTSVDGTDSQPGAFRIELLNIVEIYADNTIAGGVLFDPDDIDAAFEELDARYVAGDAAAHAHTWSLIARNYAAFNRHEFPSAAPGWMTIDHRRGISFEPGELTAYIRSTWDTAPDTSTYIETVHRVSDLGAVFTQGSKGSSQQGFEAEWREICLLTADGETFSGCELFDEGDLDAALARFDELSRPVPQLENAASQVCERFLAHFATGDWGAMAEILADNFCNEDRRRVVGAGVRSGRDAQIVDMRAIADLGITNVTSTVMANRGGRLVLMRVRFSFRDQGPEAFFTDFLGIVEANADEQIVALVSFDIDDTDAAFAELDARYLAGVAAAHSRTWSVIARTYATFNRHELPAADWVNIDHRRGTPFASSDLIAGIRALWDLTPDFRMHIAAVHRLSNFAAVITHSSQGTSHTGFDAEWRMIQLLTVEGDRVSGCELFDEADLDAALARFDELDRPTPRLENAASQVTERFVACFAARDWTAMAELLAQDMSTDDRRPVVRTGLLHGRDNNIASMRAVADVGTTNLTSTVIATRGERLALSRLRFSGRDQRPEAFYTEALGVAEINADNRIVAQVSFDPDDIDAAFMELDARYLAGEATAHAHTWSVIAGAYAALDRHELPPTAPDWVNVDRQRLALIETGDLFTHVAASWEMLPDWRIRIAALRRLTDFGAVVNWAAEGTSQEGFHAEQRGIAVLIVDGGLINRCELFEDSDLDAALARFDELSQPVPQLENAASRIYVRFNAYLAARDWDAMAEMIADDVFDDDRRRVVNGGIQRGRDAQIANLRAIVDVGVKNIEFVVMATRGERLALCRARVSGGDQRAEAFGLEMLSIIEIDTDDRFAAGISFDVDDIDAAFEELDARYLAGEAAAHSRTWSVIAGAYAALNRHELPATTPGWVNIDRQRLALIEQGDMFAHVRAAWETLPDWHIRVVAVYRLTALGAVATWAATGTSRDGFEAENQGTAVLTVDGDLITGFEMFDAEAVDAALARFDELDRPTLRLENAASQMTERFCAYFAARDWTAMDGILAQNISVDDRRRVVGAGVRHGQEAEIENLRAWADIGIKTFMQDVVAIRGRRLALCRARWSGPNQHFQAFHSEALGVVEINADNQIAARVMLDPDDIDAAFEELDARYLAGEAAEHSHTWSLITHTCAAFNQHVMPPTTPDWVNIDHRKVTAFAPGDMTPYMRVTFDVAPDIKFYIEAVHRLTGLGAVFTQRGRGISHEGFEGEWRDIILMSIEGDQFNRCEVFDETDLDAALARFDELSRPAPRLENAASQVTQRLWSYFVTRDWEAIAETLAVDCSDEDRRRVVNAGIRRGRDAEIENLRTAADLGITNITSTPIATRGGRLALVRSRFWGGDKGPEAFLTEVLVITEIDADERITALVGFDLDDIDAAFEELDARYLAGEAAAHANSWSVIARHHAAFNRHELPAMPPHLLDHRPLVKVEAGDPTSELRAMWDRTPDLRLYIEDVHRLSDLGAVLTQVSHGTSQAGFDAEWRVVELVTVDGDLVNRGELFDETDLGAALAKFDELDRPS